MRKHVHDLTVGMLASIPMAFVIAVLMWGLVWVMTSVWPDGAIGSDSTPEPVPTTITVHVPERLPAIMDPFSYDQQFLDSLDLHTLVELDDQPEPCQP